MNTCRITGEQFSLSALEIELLRKFSVPPPTTTKHERMRTLCAFNNYLNLFHGKCAATGEPLLQVFRPGVPFPVYSLPYWWSDNWDGITYGRLYDPERSLFDQLLELRNVVPQPALSINYQTLENCNFVNGSSFSKNCYLCFLCIECHDCYFSFDIRRCRDCVDCSSTYDSELCFDGVFLSRCYEVRSGFNCRNCSHSAFLRDCTACLDCFGCVGLRNARFCYFNEQLSEEEYRRRIESINWDDALEMSRYKETFVEFASNFPAIPRLEFTESSSGDFLTHCKRAEDCQYSANLEDCTNAVLVDGARDVMGLYTWGAQAELVYCTSRAGTNVHDIKFSFIVYNGSANIEYSMNCFGCHSCFACIGLRKKEFCILNRQYTKDDYFALRSEIVTRMSNPALTPIGERYGEYLPPRLAFFPYNDSDAMLFYPLSEREAVRRGFSWGSTEDRSTHFTSWDSLPSKSSEVSSAVLDQIFRCEESGRAIRFTKAELKVFQGRNLPLPRVHWLERLKERTLRR